MDGCVESLPYGFSLEACSISDDGGTRNIQGVVVVFLLVMITYW